MLIRDLLADTTTNDAVCFVGDCFSNARLKLLARVEYNLANSNRKKLLYKINIPFRLMKACEDYMRATFTRSNKRL